MSTTDLQHSKILFHVCHLLLRARALLIFMFSAAFRPVAEVDIFCSSFNGCRSIGAKYYLNFLRGTFGGKLGCFFVIEAFLLLTSNNFTNIAMLEHRLPYTIIFYTALLKV